MLIWKKYFYHTHTRGISHNSKLVNGLTEYSEYSDVDDGEL